MLNIHLELIPGCTVIVSLIYSETEGLNLLCTTVFCVMDFSWVWKLKKKGLFQAREPRHHSSRQWYFGGRRKSGNTADLGAAPRNRGILK